MATQRSEQRPPQFISSHRNQGHANGSITPLIDSYGVEQIVVSEGKSWKNLFSYIGPGFLVAIAYIDPGNFETDLQSGAQFTYELLWIILVASCAALVIQSLAANLGVVTGKHLAEHCRVEYPTVTNLVLWLLAEVAVVACDIPEVIGTAFALDMLFNIPVWCGVLIAGLSTLVLLLLQQYGEMELLALLFRFLVPWLCLTTSSFILLWFSREKFHVQFRELNGAVCSSENLNEEDRKNCQDLDLNKASFLLKNVLGNWSSKLFAIALLASGQSSTITGTYAGQYVMQGFLNLRMEPWLRNLLTRSLAIVPSLIVSLIGGSTGAGQLIIIASMILSFELPFALVPLLKFTSSKMKMGLHANSTVISVLTWVIGSLIMAINIYFLVSSFINALLHSRLPTASAVFAGLFGFSAILVYLAGVIYLVFRKNTKTIQPLLAEDSELGQRPERSSVEMPREDIVNLQLPQGGSSSA